MNTRILKRREYGKLIGTELELVYSSLSKDSKVVVVENDNGEILGTWALIPYYHVECFWVREDFRRNGSVVKGLFRTMFNLLRSLGINSVLTASLDDKITKYLLRLGSKELPGKHFVLPVGDK